MTKDIEVFSLLSFTIILIPIFLIIYKLKLNIIKDTIISILRMVVQLFFVGVYLHYIFDWNNHFINISYFIFMVMVASFSVVRTSKINIKYFLIPIFLSILIPNIIILLFFNYFVIDLDNLFDAKYIIPIGGMLLGNSLKGNIIAISNFLKSIKENEKKYFYTIMLGAGKIEAILPFIRKSMTLSINPTIAAMATIGLVSLPGMMTGQILGGSSPDVAIKYQIAIMLAIFCSQFFGSILCIYLSSKIGFNDYDLLRND